MRHLRIQQNNITELTNYKLIHKLYDIVSNSELDNSSLLQGVVNSNYVYDKDYDYFSSFNYFQINYNIDKIICFEDPLVEQILLSKNIGNTTYNFVTYSNAANVTYLDGSVFGNGGNGTEITTFNEFKLFTSLSQPAQYQFTHCANLTSIQYPAVATLVPASGHNANTSLTNVKIDNTVIRQIAQGGFETCTALESIVLPPTCTSLGRWAFNTCTALKTINLENVTSLAENAFQYCSLLNNIDTSNVQSISQYTFYNCSSLTSLDLTGLNETVISGVSGVVIPAYCFSGCTNLTSITINNVIKIERNAFSGCQSLTSFNLLACKTIDTEAFKNCKSLTSVVLSSDIDKLLASVFAGCSSLSQINLNNIKYVYSNCLKGTLLRSISLPAIEAVYSQAFAYAKDIEQIEFGPNLTLIEDTAFWDSNITTLIFNSIDPPTHNYTSSHNRFKYNGGGLKIYVPDISLNAYKEAWPNDASLIYPISSL